MLYPVMTSGSSFRMISLNLSMISVSVPVAESQLRISPFSYTHEHIVSRKSCRTLFSMSKERIFNPGSKESMFSKESIFTIRSVA